LRRWKFAQMGSQCPDSRPDTPKTMRFPKKLLACLALGALSQLPTMRADTAPFQNPRGAELAALASSTEQELKGDILPFWMKYTRNGPTGT